MSFGKALASLHKIKSNQFGLDHDNFIGLTPQSNTPSPDWVDFFKNQRLLFQFKLAKKNKLIDHDFETKFFYLIDKIDKIIGPKETTPSLVHGDLWSGNFIATLDDSPSIFDPAVYFGDREVDIAMTKLFGGFNSSFYQSYNESYPLSSGYEKRFDLYNLYHLLNHMNLFGLGYKTQAKEIIESLI